ncbi:MAG: alkyl sulfatase BDS1-like metallo-beta-lactamase superfamily hydrolase [Moritella dasanensis]|jgi:alkyl sulfatase BDS1-like metallo-beta-lactamase superfamily hydrolase
MKKIFIIAGAALLLAIDGTGTFNRITTAMSSVSIEPKVDARLAEFQEKLDDPELVGMGKAGRVNMVVGYDYANWTIIDGDDGLIVVDTGWFIERTKQALEDYREKNNNSKPIKAIILTHMHSDHIGGIEGLFEDGQFDGVDIYAHQDWQKQVQNDINAGPMLLRRGMSQMGFLLPYKDIEKGTFGAGIGRSALLGGTVSRTVKPTKFIDVDENTSKVAMTILGVPMEFHYGPSDVDEQLLVWLPEDKVVLTGDAMGGTLPYVITPRHEPERKSESFLYTFDTILGFDATDIIPGHGRPLRGKEDIESVIGATYDVVSFLYDQVRRYVHKGYSADQIIDVLELPARLANHPDLQPRYHTLDWLIRGLYSIEAGWVQNVNTLTQHSASEQAKRMIELVGETDLLLTGKQALIDEDYRWAISLAQIAIDADASNEAAQKIMMGGLQGVAYTTDSSAERNYVLTELGQLAGKVQWDDIFTRVSSRLWKYRDADATFNLFGRRFESKDSFGQQFSIQFDVPNSGSYSFIVNDGVIRYQTTALAEADAVVSIQLASVRQIGSGQLSVEEALALDSTKVTKGEQTAKKFAALIML